MFIQIDSMEQSQTNVPNLFHKVHIQIVDLRLQVTLDERGAQETRRPVDWVQSHCWWQETKFYLLHHTPHKRGDVKREIHALVGKHQHSVPLGFGVEAVGGATKHHFVSSHGEVAVASLTAVG